MNGLFSPYSSICHISWHKFCSILFFRIRIFLQKNNWNFVIKFCYFFWQMALKFTRHYSWQLNNRRQKWQNKMVVISTQWGQHSNPPKKKNFKSSNLLRNSKKFLPTRRNKRKRPTMVISERWSLVARNRSLSKW